MKKFTAIVMAVVMLVTCAACGAKKAEGETVPGSATLAVEAEADNAEAESEGSTVKIGLICLHDENSTYDKNFLDAFKAACEVKGVEYEIKTGIPETNECYEAAADLVDRECNIIFADSFGHESFILQAAQEFPEVEFCHATGTMAHTENLPNFHNAFASIYEGRYLAGVAAGIKLQDMMMNDASVEPKVGYVSAFPYAECCSGYTSWFLGLRSVVPEATMEVLFTGSWYDESLEKEGAQKLIGDGCVLISQHADSMGCPTACEEAGVPDVTYNGSLLESCPNTSIISSKINWQPYFEYIIDCKLNGEAIDTDWTGTIGTGSVVITELNANIMPEGAAETLKEIEDKVASGEIKVFDTTTFTVGGETLDSYQADVDTDAEYTPDTEVVEDGEFKESKFRSAPYFDLTIDGITILGNIE